MAKGKLRNNRNKAAPKNDEEFIYLKLRRDEYKLLRAKVREVVAEYARARKRMAKYQKEIDKQKRITDRLLARSSARHSLST